MKLTKKGTKNNSKIWKFFERKTDKKDNKYEIKNMSEKHKQKLKEHQKKLL